MSVTTAAPPAEVLRLLPRAPHGRAAVTRHALPHIVPARHLVTGDRLLLMAAEHVDPRLLDGVVLAYQADTYGCCGCHGCCPDADRAGNPAGIPGAGSGGRWGAQLIGTAQVVDPTDEERAAFSAFPPPLSSPSPALYARLTPHFATMRRP